MRTYKVTREWHTVYDPGDAVPDDIKIVSDWRKADIGDWICTDDGCVMQVLRRADMTKAKGKVRKSHYIGTCTGTFPIQSKGIDGSKRKNIYSFSGKTEAESTMARKHLTKHEIVFVQYVASGMHPRDAYLKAYDTKNPGYAVIKSGNLLKTERVRTQMKKELEPVMETLGLDEDFVLRNIKKVIESTDKDDTKLKALFKLSDIMDMEDKTKTSVTQISGAVFQGFSDDKLKEVKRPKELDA